MFDSLLFWLIITLISNLLLILIVWNIYGSRIQILIAKKEEKQQILGIFE
jgi:capsular polysaccharide biosynthesis protein